MLQLAWPVVLAELGWMLQGVVDVIMVGRLGPVAIGAVALGNALYYAPSLFGLGLMLGLDTVVAHAYGRGDHEACHRWLAQGVYVAVISTVPLMLITFGFCTRALAGCAAGVSFLLSHCLLYCLRVSTDGKRVFQF